MLDQLRIGDAYSYDQFYASVMKRSISAPKKKVIKDTVPFSNVTYDFSAIDGEIYWEERNLDYIFEITADTPEELEELKTNFQTWIMNVMSEKLYDPFIKDYHFLATFSDISFDDDEGMEKTTVTVKFTAHPYKIANDKKVYTVNVTAEETILKVENKSAHRITPTLISDVPVTIKIGNENFQMGAATVAEERLKIGTGSNEISVTATNANGTFTIEFVEEVF